jgi:hypothetical protein
MEHWQNTELWKLLGESSDEAAVDVRRTVESLMKDIEPVLARGETSPSDFTLHDEGHAFRVAERMCQIVPKDVVDQLSSYELAFLLLSAYLHDIGMTPKQEKVKQHYKYLLTAEDNLLTETEVNDFQRWLDDNAEGLEPPLTDGAPSSSDLSRATEILTHYCRSQHNDWSEEWMRANLADTKLGTYHNWLNDLVALCRSHHEGYARLKSARFDPTWIGAPPLTVHLRYLACVLRVADILEFDPERTPDVVFQHRDISPDSVIHWRRGQEVSLNLDERHHLAISARPTQARLHKAVLEMVHDINVELTLCKQLDGETHFEKCPGKPDDLPHKWVLPSQVHPQIQPAEGTYEYIDGAFRPNTQKLLQLFAGTELYGNPLLAVRELLQNAFDAVREEMARDRLNQTTPGDPQHGERLAQNHKVELRFEHAEDAYWLVCHDNGVGMTKAIIENYVLVSGASIRHDIRQLERQCRDAGFRLGRSGQFGIGVLSYFMLADVAIFQTRRSVLGDESDNQGGNSKPQALADSANSARRRSREMAQPFGSGCAKGPWLTQPHGIKVCGRFSARHSSIFLVNSS